MQNTKMDFVKVKKLAKVILTSSLKLTGVCAIYFINLARAILNRTSEYFTSFISNQFTLSISLKNKNSEIVLNKKASISSISKYLVMFGLIFVLVAAMFSVAINAADPGHGASVIGSGVFESGTYTFPLNLIINSNLSIGVRSLFVNSNLTRIGIGTNEPSNTLDVRGAINASGEIYVNNQTALSTFAYNESSSYQQFWYNQSDNSQLLFNYNQSAGSFNQYGIYWYNQSDNSLLLFNYNQSSASETQFGKFWYNMSDGGADGNSDNLVNVAFVNNSNRFTGLNNFSTDIYLNNGTLVSTWLYNQSDNSQLLFNYNQSTGSFNQYGIYWYNQSDNSLLLFNYNQSSASETQFGKFWYNMSDGGADGNSDNLVNVAFVNNSNRFTGLNNFSTDIYLNNGTLVSTWLYNQSDNSQLLFNYNQSTGSFNQYGIYWYNQSDNSLLLFNYNQSSASETQFGKFLYNMSDGGADGNSDNLLNVAFVNNSNRFTGLNNFSGDLIINNQTFISTWLYNQSDNSQLLFNYNQSTGSFNQYGIYWYNQSDNSLLLFNYNQSSASETQFGKFWYNMSDGGADGNSDNLVNVAFVNNSNRFTGLNNFSGDLIINNQTFISTWLYNQSDNSQLLFNYNQSTGS